MEVLVTGGRNYSDREEIYKTLDTLNRETKVTLLIEGGATGADRLSYDWAISRGVKTKRYNADWKDLTQPDARIKTGPYGPYDAQAGHRRNKLMLTSHPTAIVVAFKGSYGTKDCIKTAKSLGRIIKKIGDW